MHVRIRRRLGVSPAPVLLYGPLIVRPALAELLGVAPNSLMVNDWVGYMQYVPAVAGGIFGQTGRSSSRCW